LTPPFLIVRGDMLDMHLERADKVPTKKLGALVPWAHGSIPEKLVITC